MGECREHTANVHYKRGAQRDMCDEMNSHEQQRTTERDTKKQPTDII